MARWEKEPANPSYLTKIKGLWCWDSYSIPVEFTLPDCSDVASIGEYGLQRLNAIIGAYEASLGQAGPAAAPRGFETDLPPGEFQKFDGRTADRGLGEGGE